MKVRVFLFVLVIFTFFASGVLAETPAEFINCANSDFTFSDLSYYEKEELISGYCSCRKNYESYNKLTVLSIKQQTNALQLYGISSPKTKQYEEESDKYRKLSTTADSNSSKILRILKKDHNVTDDPKCE